jgi:exonuclease VII small subunit
MAEDKQALDKLAADEQIEFYLAQFRCQGSADDLEIARNANNELLRLGHYGKANTTQAQAKFERNQNTLEKIAERLEDKDLNNLINRAKDGMDADEAREEFLSWAINNPEKSEKVIEGLKALALRIAHNSEALPEDWDRAAEILREAQQLAQENSEHVNGRTRNMLKTALDEIKVGRLSAMAQFGVSNNPYSFWHEYGKTLNDVSDKVWKACQGRGTNSESCANALRVQQGVQNLPNVAQQAEYRQAQLLNQVHGAQSGAMGGMFAGGPNTMGMGMNNGFGGGFPTSNPNATYNMNPYSMPQMNNMYGSPYGMQMGNGLMGGMMGGMGGMSSMMPGMGGMGMMGGMMPGMGGMGMMGGMPMRSPMMGF